jgi:hypothetical protein
MQVERTEEVVPERVFMAVDVNNLWHLCRAEFGQCARVRFDYLLYRVGLGGFHNVPRKIHAVAYAITVPRRRVSSNGNVRETSSNNSRFLESMAGFGYEIQTRTMRFEKGVNKPFHTDWDVGITIDSLEKIDSYDTFILASGDGDYTPLLAKLRERNKRIEIYTFQGSMARILHEVADRVCYLTATDTYQARPTK